MWSDSLGKIDQLQERLDDLKDAYEDNGLSVSGGLLAPVCEQELRDFCADWFPVDLPDELIALYGWRGGWSEFNNYFDDDGNVTDATDYAPFYFRDCLFSDLKTVQCNYEAALQYEYDMNGESLLYELRQYAFPFAASDSSLLMLPCKDLGIDFGVESRKPIISDLEQISVWFGSIEQMLATCIDWVRHGDGFPVPQAEEEELAIWQKHNPAGVIDLSTIFHP